MKKVRPKKPVLFRPEKCSGAKSGVEHFSTEVCGLGTCAFFGGRRDGVPMMTFFSVCEKKFPRKKKFFRPARGSSRRVRKPQKHPRHPPTDPTTRQRAKQRGQLGPQTASSDNACRTRKKKKRERNASEPTTNPAATGGTAQLLFSNFCCFRRGRRRKQGNRAGAEARAPTPPNGPAQQPTSQPKTKHARSDLFSAGSAPAAAQPCMHAAGNAATPAACTAWTARTASGGQKTKPSTQSSSNATNQPTKTKHARNDPFSALLCGKTPQNAKTRRKHKPSSSCVRTRLEDSSTGRGAMFWHAFQVFDATTRVGGHVIF